MTTESESYNDDETIRNLISESGRLLKSIIDPECLQEITLGRKDHLEILSKYFRLVSKNPPSSNTFKLLRPTQDRSMMFGNIGNYNLIISGLVNDELRATKIQVMEKPKIDPMLVDLNAYPAFKPKKVFNDDMNTILDITSISPKNWFFISDIIPLTCLFLDVPSPKPLEQIENEDATYGIQAVVMQNLSIYAQVDKIEPLRHERPTEFYHWKPVINNGDQIIIARIPTNEIFINLFLQANRPINFRI